VIERHIFFVILLIYFQPIFCVRIGGVQMARVAGDTLALRSSGFKYGGCLPAKYTIDGGNIFPALSWKPGPCGTASFVVMCVHPDAPTGDTVLWIVYNIPPVVTGLPEKFINPNHNYGDGIATVRDGIKQIGYEGINLPKKFPVPQDYFFIIFALDTTLNFLKESDVLKEDVFRTIKGHELAAGILKGSYTKEPEATPIFSS